MQKKEKTEDEVSFEEMINNFRSYLLFIKKKWILIFVAGIAGAIMGLIVAILKKPKFEAKTTFVLSSDNKSGGLAGLASQFGFDFGNVGGDAFSGENIITLFKSETLFKRALFRVSPQGKESLLNLYCIDSKLHKEWTKSQRLKNAFPFPEKPEQMTPIQDSLFREIHSLLVKDHVVVEKPDKKSGIYNIKTISNNEVFSTYFTRYLVDVTTQFYIETKTKLAKQNLDMLQKEADSIRGLLGGSIISTAYAADRVFNLNPAFQMSRTDVQKSQTQTTVLAAAYGEVVKNLEIAKITLQKETPLFQIIDEPSMPIKAIKLRKLYAIIIGGVLAGILTLLFLFVSFSKHNHKQ